MDTRKKELLQRDNFIILLPDLENSTDGPATLYMIPKDAITAWVKMTPELNEAMEALRKMAFGQAFKLHPEKMTKFMNGDDSQLDDELFDSIMADPKFKKTITIIHIAAMVDYRNTLGNEEFDDSYKVKDKEIIEEFVEKAEWNAYDSTDGWATGETVKERVSYDPESGRASIESS